MNIDLVILWVDGSDPDWRRDYNTFTHEDGDKSDARFRDWGILHYWFRSIEVNLPWIRKIHFVTWGHIPSWLSINHPKLNIVNHHDFLDIKNLPVFNSRAIECNLHKIPDLAERFVYFNDDMFVLRRVDKEYYFLNGLPRDLFALNIISTDITAHMKINNIKILNGYFDKKEVLLRLFRKWFRPSNRIEFIKSILLLPWPQFTGFFNHHLPQPFLKSTFNKVWDAEPEILKLTSSSKFKKSSDVNQFLFKWWQILEGNFEPRTFRRAKNISIWTYADAAKAASLIRENKLEMICLNDHLSDGSFDESIKIIQEAFAYRFPGKSSFEL